MYEEAGLSPEPGWPVWIKDFAHSRRTDHTSGIICVGRDAEGRSCFFLADDIGLLYYCTVESAKVALAHPKLTLDRVRFSPTIVAALSELSHWDFEGLAIDRAHHKYTAAVPDTVQAFLSVEGHGVGATDEARVLRVRFVLIADIDAEVGASADSRRTWRVEYLEEAMPGARFWAGSTHPDRGLKGIAAGEHYLQLGLESIDARGQLNVHGTVLFSYDRVADLVTTQSTLSWGVRSICGAEAVSDSVTVLLDRNAQAINILRWDQKRPGWISSVHRFPLQLSGPDGHRYAIPSVEGVAVDERGDVWCVMDPWHGHHRLIDAAPESVYVYIAAEIPMLYRFAGEPIWSACGLSNLWQGEQEK